jgi:hypothetical protein
MRVGQWSRGLRVAIYWSATMLMALVVIPFFIAVGADLLGLLACDQLNGAASEICSPPGRVLSAVVLVSVTLACFLPLARLLQRNLGIQGNVTPGRQPSSALPAAVLGKGKSLGLGQELVIGRIEAHSPSGRTMQFSDTTLTLWSLYPFQKGWLRQGDQLVVVYQKIPFSKNAKFAMAFWNGPPNPVRGVAAITQSLAVFIAAACALMFSWLSGPLTVMWLGVCIFGAAVGTAYLVLMLKAKAALRSFLASGL